MAQHLWARLLLPTIMPKVKKNCCSTTQNIHQCSPIWKKSFWRAFQHLPFQDPCHLSKSIFSCHLAFYNKLHQMFHFKGSIFCLYCWFIILDLNKLQPPSPVVFTPICYLPFPSTAPPGTDPPPASCFGAVRRRLRPGPASGRVSAHRSRGPKRTPLLAQGVDRSPSSFDGILNASPIKRWKYTHEGYSNIAAENQWLEDLLLSYFPFGDMLVFYGQKKHHKKAKK